MTHQKIGFIGAGQMATAIARGIVDAKIIPSTAVFAADPDETARERFAAAVAGATLAQTNADLARQVGVIVLAVKPQRTVQVLEEVREEVQDKLVISIAAGVRLAQMESAVLQSTRLVRVMPNTPCLVRMGASAYARGASSTPEDGILVGKLLSAVGEARPMDESLLDAVTGLSGSGPAFVYTVIEALTDGGVAAGLPRHHAHALAVQTVRGTAEMVRTTGEHPAVLRDRVTSPGGTTIAGMTALEAVGLRHALIEAVLGATERSKELGEETY